MPAPPSDSSFLWRIECFGGLRAVRGDVTVERFRTRRGAALLAFLTCHPDRAHSRDSLAEMLWPDAPPGMGRDRLKNELSALRRQLAEDAPGGGTAAQVFRTVGRDGVALGPGATSDVSEFRAAVNRAARRDTPESERIDLLGRAADLTGRGDLLPGSDEEWVIGERERLREARLDVLCRLSAALLAAGRVEEARARAAEAVRGFPDRDEAADALRAATAARAGAVPVPAPTAPDGAVVPTPPLAGRGVPRPATRFFGRVDELARVVGWASEEPEEAGRLLTVTGPGGVGKTRLVLEAGALLAAGLPGGAGPDPVIFVPLEDAGTAEQFQDALLAALGGESDVEAAISALPRPLLVLDNFEQVAEAAAAPLAALLAACPRLRCLVTSRRLLDITGEEELSLGPLPIPTTAREPFETLAARPSVRLFVDRARLARADFALTPRTAPAVADICRLLEGVPLAIELAAARSLVLGPAQMREQLADRFAFLVSRRRDLPERQRSLRAAVEWSVALLTPALRHVFARLSVFRGGFTLDAAEAVCGGKAGSMLGDLERLRADSLLGAAPAPDGGGEGHFTLLESLRLYADDLLAPDERADARRRHAEFFAARLAEAAAADGPGWGRPAAHRLTLFDAEAENLHAALDWWLGEGARRPERLLRLVCALEPCWFARGRYAAAEAAYLRALAATAGAGDTPERGDAHVCASTFVRSRGDHAGADRLLAEAGRIYAAVGDAAGAAEALTERGYVALRVRNLAAARRLLEAGLDLFRRLGDVLGAASARSLLGLVALGEGNTAEGVALLADSLVAFDAAGDARSAAYVAHDLGAAELRRTDGEGDPSAAEPLVARALTHFAAVGEGQGIAFCLEGFAGVAARRGAWTRSATLHAAAARLRAELDLPLPPYDAVHRDAALATVRAALPAPAFDAAWSEGDRLTTEKAVTLALTPADG